MLRITVELIPFGIESKKREIGKCTIGNDLTGTKEKGNYTMFLKDENHQYASKIKNFDRLNKSAWELLLEGLKKIYNEVKE